MNNIIKQGILFGRLCELLQSLQSFEVGDEQDSDRAVNELVDVCKELNECPGNWDEQTLINGPLKLIAVKDPTAFISREEALEAILNKYGRSLKDE